MALLTNCNCFTCGHKWTGDAYQFPKCPKCLKVRQAAETLKKLALLSSFTAITNPVHCNR